MAKGTTARAIRVPDDTWAAAVAAFPSERGKTGGLSAKVQAYIAFLAEHPDAWERIEAAAAEHGVEPWRLIPDAVAAYNP